MNALDTEDQALQVEVLDGDVVLLGPRVAVALSAAAAAETARRLADAAELAATAPVTIFKLHKLELEPR